MKVKLSPYERAVNRLSFLRESDLAVELEDACRADMKRDLERDDRITKLSAALRECVETLEQAESGHAADCQVNSNTSLDMSGCSCRWQDRRVDALAAAEEALRCSKERI